MLGGDDLAASGLSGCAHLGLSGALACLAFVLRAFGGQRVVLDALLRRQRQEGVSRAFAFADVLGDDGFEVGQRLRVFHGGGLGGAFGLGGFHGGLSVLGVLLQLGVVGGFNNPANRILLRVLAHAVAVPVTKHIFVQDFTVQGARNIGFLLVGVSGLEIEPASLEQFGLCLGFQLGDHGILVRHQRFKRCLELLGRGLSFAHRLHHVVVAVNGRGLAGRLLLGHAVCLGQAFAVLRVHLVDHAGQRRHVLAHGRCRSLGLVRRRHGVPQAIHAELAPGLADAVDFAVVLFV